MKIFFVFAALFIAIVFLKPKCSRDVAIKECVKVCEDIGYNVPISVTQTGFWTFKCNCSSWKPDRSLKRP